MKICYFGTYDPSYQRNRLIKKGLERNGIKIVECVVPYSIWFWVYIRLFFKWLSIKKDFSAVIVGETGYILMPLSWLLSLMWGKKLFLDAFFSYYDALVFDRKTVKPGSFKALKLYWIDRIGCILAEYIILDTKEHIQYFKSEFKLNNKKFIVVPVGADDDVFYPSAGPGIINFNLLFWGSFLPLHGTDIIVEAARLLAEYKDIRIKLIGGGQTHGETMAIAKKYNLSNIEFLDAVSEKVLSDEIRKSSACLGIFGKTPKASRVIPHKIYQAIASKKAVITLDTHALGEYFIDGENIILIKNSEAAELAESVLVLYHSRPKTKEIAENAYELYKKNFRPQDIVKDIIHLI